MKHKYLNLINNNKNNTIMKKEEQVGRKDTDVGKEGQEGFKKDGQATGLHDDTCG